MQCDARRRTNADTQSMQGAMTARQGLPPQTRRRRWAAQFPQRPRCCLAGGRRCFQTRDWEPPVIGPFTRCRGFCRQGIDRIQGASSEWRRGGDSCLVRPQVERGCHPNWHRHGGGTNQFDPEVSSSMKALLFLEARLFFACITPFWKGDSLSELHFDVTYLISQHLSM